MNLTTRYSVRPIYILHCTCYTTGTIFLRKEAKANISGDQWATSEIIDATIDTRIWFHFLYDLLNLAAMKSILLCIIRIRWKRFPGTRYKSIKPIKLISNKTSSLELPLKLHTKERGSCWRGTVLQASMMAVELTKLLDFSHSTSLVYHFQPRDHWYARAICLFDTHRVLAHPDLLVPEARLLHRYSPNHGVL